MTAFNAVRFRVKPGHDRDFLDAHANLISDWPGLRRAAMIRTGARDYCLIAEWPDSDTLGEARPQMIATLNAFRDALEELGEGKGVTDAVSGEAVLDFVR